MAEKFTLVFPSDLIKFAQSLRRSIIGRLKWSRQLRNSTAIGRVKYSKGSISVVLSVGVGKDKSGMPLGGMARAYEFGSGIHGKLGTTYEIVPRKKPYLMFSSTLGIHGGSVIKTLHVNHPGVDPRPFIKPVLESRKDDIKELGISVRTNLITQMRASFKKVSK